MDCTALEAIRNNTGQGPGPYILVMAAKKGDRLFRSGHSRQEVVGQARGEIAAVYGQLEFPSRLDSQTRSN